MDQMDWEADSHQAWRYVEPKDSSPYPQKYVADSVLSQIKSFTA
jgi:hypothetical protein